MKRLIAGILLSFFFSTTGYSQTSQIEKLNLDFERNTNGHPDEWNDYGNNGKVYTDSVSPFKGKYAAVIENSKSSSNLVKALILTLPENYKGKIIRLSGYIKTENVTGGYAGLFIRIDPIALENMNDRGITGTTGWKKYEITLPLNPRKTDKIIFGCLLSGKGKMWIDNLSVTIDDKNLDDKDLEIYKKEPLPAEKDKEFDKGSGIIFPALNSRIINNLELLGKTWGFIKYHHPEVAKGNYDWDYELFRMLPGYLNVKNNQQRDRFLVSSINKYGKLPPCITCKPTSKDAVLKPDLAWMDDGNLSGILKLMLKEIYNNRNQGENYYIRLVLGTKNPDFTNEKPYSDMPYPDAGFRLLALYRYWNMIRYFYPNRHLTNKKWDTVLKEYIPEFLNAKNQLQYELATIKVIGEINDTHANLYTEGEKMAELRGDNFAPFRAEFIQNKLVVTDYYNPEFADDARLKIGDIITHIDGRAIASIVDSLEMYYPASNKASMLRDIAPDLLRSPKDQITLEYISEGRDIKQNITLYNRKHLNRYGLYKLNENEKCFKILEGNIGYITLANIQEEDITQIKESLKNTKGIIIDIRNYPSTYVPFELGSYFMSVPTAFVKLTYGNPDNPGEFTYKDAVKIPGDTNYYKGKLVVLVNENSQSQAEYTAMAFRAVKNSKIIGSTTAGADGDVSYIYLPGGLITMISGLGVYYPDGRVTQRLGIVPDIVVKPTIEGIKKGKDEVLEKAIEILNQ
jgi:C-terminal processing protease CtpA/Prc